MLAIHIRTSIRNKNTNLKNISLQHAIYVSHLYVFWITEEHTIPQAHPKSEHWSIFSPTLSEEIDKICSLDTISNNNNIYVHVILVNAYFLTWQLQ